MRSAAALLLAACAISHPAGAGVPWALADGGWRTDPIWHDGKAEVAVYDATREIYGVERRYVASAYTNAQHMDPGTTTKSDGGEGVLVFKHHWSERVPTERYDYDFSTAAFLEREDLRPFKLTAASQEDCGASFRQLWRAEGGEARLRFLESVYLPGAGLREGAIDSAGVQLEDALPLALRSFPFGDAEAREREWRLRLVPGQRSNRSVPFEPRSALVRYEGEETLALPVGEVRAHRLSVAPEGGGEGSRYWMAAEGAAPWLHAMVAMEGPGGVSYRLRSLERDAYWERGG